MRSTNVCWTGKGSVVSEPTRWSTLAADTAVVTSETSFQLPHDNCGQSSKELSYILCPICLKFRSDIMAWLDQPKFPFCIRVCQQRCLVWLSQFFNIFLHRKISPASQQETHICWGPAVMTSKLHITLVVRLTVTSFYIMSNVKTT
jgi:hypothetical protein